MSLNTDPYEKEWKEITDLESKGLPKSALEKVLVLYQRAKTANDPSQVIKTLIFRSKYTSQLEEDGFVKTINALDSDLYVSTFPIKPILQSMIAEMYNGYLTNNLWKIRNRTTTADFKNDDVSTWDAQAITKISADLYIQSVSDPRIKDISLKDFAALIQSGDFKYRPTLYDFLAYRAIAYFNDDKSYLSQPAIHFNLDDVRYFAPAKEFIALNLPVHDSTDHSWWALKLTQDVLRNAEQRLMSAAQKNDISTFIDADLQRLEYIHQKTTLENKDELYLAALGNLLETYKNDSVSVEIAFKMAQVHRTKAQKFKPSDPNKTFKNENNIALGILQNVVKKFPTAYDAKSCRNLIKEILSSSFSFEIERVNLSEKPILAKINFKNTPEIYFRVIRITEKKPRNNNNEENLEYYRNLSFAKQKTLKLPDDGDYNDHGTEIKIDGLPFGQYVLLASNNEKFTNSNKQTNGNQQLPMNNIVCQTLFQISNLAYFQRKGEKTPNEFIVVNRTTGQPLENVTAEFYENRYNNKTNLSETLKIGSAVSDKDGFIRPKLDDNKYFTAKFTKDKDVLVTEDYFSEYKNNREQDTQQQTHFFLDRAIYRPGQIVYYKAILIERTTNNNGAYFAPKIVPNKAIEITFYDANRQKISSQKLRTNEFGSVNGNFITPTSGLLGEMSLESDEDGNKNFRVEEYKRPKFETKIDTLSGTYTLGQTTTIKGNAKAFAGSNIDNAQVKYRVVRNTRFPYWRDFYWTPSWYNAKPVEIAHGETKTDANGLFSINFEAIADKSVPRDSKPTFEFTVYADVTDITGETHSAQQSVSIGYTSLLINIQTPELIERKDLKPLKITATNLNGQPLEAKGTIKLDLLTAPTKIFNKRDWFAPDTVSMNETEFKRDFPEYAYRGEDKKENWAVKSSVVSGQWSVVSIKEKLNSNLYQLPEKLASGTYRLTLETSDATGEKITVIKYFTVYDSKEKAPAQTVLLSNFEQKNYQPNETVTLNINTAADYIWVLIEDDWNGKVQNHTWKKISGAELHKLQITEAQRGNAFVHFTGVRNNRAFGETRMISVPFTNKELHFTYQTFRDKLLPGAEEEWHITISGEKKEKLAAEMVAAMYDASLDQFAPNEWNFDLYPLRYNSQNWIAYSFGSIGSSYFYSNTNPESTYDAPRIYPSLNWFNFEFGERYGRNRVYSMRAAPRSMNADKNAPPPPAAEKESDSNSLNETVVIGYNTNQKLKNDKSLEFQNQSANFTIGKVAGIEFNDPNEKIPSTQPTDFSPIKSRTNLNETVFFYPNLLTDSAGNVVVKFKMNEALTRWKFLALAHTKDLKVGISEKSIVTQKDLMIIPNTPRFVREGDMIEMSAKVTNLSDKTLSGDAALQLSDALTLKTVNYQLSTNSSTTFTIKPGESAPLFWNIKIPVNGAQALTLRYVAKAGDFSDAEETTIPVLTNRQLVTETMPMNVRGGTTKSFKLADSFWQMADSKKPTANSQQLIALKLEFTQNPAWYAVQALPYLMEYPYECTEQLFSRYYANALAAHVTNSHPKIKAVFDRWRTIDVEALKSNLSKNQELKTALLEETPWVLQAQNEEVQKKNIALLFDLNKMADASQNALNKMRDRQQSDGGYAWFPGGRNSWFITQYIVCGFGHLKSLGVGKTKTSTTGTDAAQKMIADALKFCDSEFEKNYTELDKMFTAKKLNREDDHLSSLVIQYLYAKTFFPDSLSLPSDNKNKPTANSQRQIATDYFMQQAEKYWLSRGIYEQAMIALIMKRNGKSSVTEAIIRSLKERAINNDELGMYWKSDWGYNWYQQPIETQSMMIELFNEAGDRKSVEDLKIWLLKNKQTNAWRTTKATAEAVYALLNSGENWLDDTRDVSIKINDKPLDLSGVKKEAGTGYFKIDLLENGKLLMVNGKSNDEKVFTDYHLPFTIEVNNPKSEIVWGALYWQYLENLDKIKTFKATPLTIDKKLFVTSNTDKGEIITPIRDTSHLKPGDKIKVRIELRVDRDMEFVHMKDMRAAGFEPFNVLSGYKYQGGLGYYEMTRDASTNFFFDYLPKGTYVFEYPLFVNQRGDMSNGITTIQCMYAPEFTSHSEGVRVLIGN